MGIVVPSKCYGYCHVHFIMLQPLIHLKAQTTQRQTTLTVKQVHKCLYNYIILLNISSNMAVHFREKKMALKVINS